MACARDPAKGAAAVAELVAGGVGAAQIQFRRLDIDDQVRTQLGRGAVPSFSSFSSPSTAIHFSALRPDSP